MDGLRGMVATVEHARTPEVISDVRPVNERQARRFAEDPELISIRATQALLGDVSDKTVRRLVKAGRIEAVKVGARIMPRLASVRSFARGG
jgi:Helix-turn-helix domain